jgi:hypothetical protein
MVWYSEKGCYLHGLWMFLLESAKDRFIVVDPPPKTTCATTCPVWNDLLTNYGTFRYVSCSRSMGNGVAIPGNRLVQEGP